MGINEKLLDELMKDYKSPEDLLGGERVTQAANEGIAGEGVRG